MKSVKEYKNVDWIDLSVKKLRYRPKDPGRIFFNPQSAVRQFYMHYFGSKNDNTDFFTH